MKLSHIVSASLISMAAFGCQKDFQLPPLFQQRELKGNHAGMQVLAMGMFRQCMRHDGFRRYAQERVRSEVSSVLGHVMDHATPSHLSEDGEIPQDRLISTNGVGPCSLNFYKGKFNIKRKGQIKRIPRGNVDGTLSQLDEKTINHYLSIAKISMSRCSDDSVMLRSHLELPGGALEIVVYNGLMWIMQGGARLMHAITIREGIHGLSVLAEQGYNYVRRNGAAVARNRLSDTGQQMARGLVQAMEGMAGPALNYVQQYGSTPVEIGVNMLQSGAQSLAETGINALNGVTPDLSVQNIRDTAQSIMGNNTVVSQVTDTAGRLMHQFTTAEGGTYFVYAAADAIHNTMPETSQGIAVASAASPGIWDFFYKLLEVSIRFRW